MTDESACEDIRPSRFKQTVNNTSSSSSDSYDGGNTVRKVYGGDNVDAGITEPSSMINMYNNMDHEYVKHVMGDFHCFV